MEPNDLNERLTALEHHSGTILYLSAVNMIMNALMILAAFFLGGV